MSGTYPAPHFASVTLDTPLTVSGGGTGSSSAATARSNLGAAASGANSDITSLTGLTAPLSLGQGGTGATTAAGIAGAISANFYVATIAALRALTSATTATTASVSGYAAPADGGGGIFVVNANDTASADNGGTIIVDAAGRRWYRIYSGALNVKYFGAKGNGVTDDTAAIQATINAGGANCQIYLPAGTYLNNSASGSITISNSGVSISGAGQGVTTIQATGSSPAAIFAALSSTDKSDITISDMTLDINGVNSGIQVQYVSRFTVRRCRIINNQYWGINIGVTLGTSTTVANSEVTIEDCWFGGGKSTYESLLLFNCAKITVNNCYFDSGASGTPGVGLYQNLDRVSISSCHFDGLDIGLYYSVSTNNISISGCSFSGCTVGVEGANQSDNGAFGQNTVYGLSIANCTFESGGVHMQLGATQGASVSNCTFYNSQQQPMQITQGNSPVSPSANFPMISNCEFRNNCLNAGGSTNNAAILISGAANSFGIITGCAFEDNQATPTQNYPIVFSGAYTFTGWRAFGCVITPYNSATSVAVAGGATISSFVLYGCTNVSATLPSGVSQV